MQVSQLVMAFIASAFSVCQSMPTHSSKKFGKEEPMVLFEYLGNCRQWIKLA
jgi:hypothetical protein